MLRVSYNPEVPPCQKKHTKLLKLSVYPTKARIMRFAMRWPRRARPSEIWTGLRSIRFGVRSGMASPNSKCR